MVSEPDGQHATITLKADHTQLNFVGDAERVGVDDRDGVVGAIAHIDPVIRCQHAGRTAAAKTGASERISGPNEFEDARYRRFGHVHHT